MQDYLIAVDIGTQGTKAMIFTTDLKEISSSFEASRLISPRPGVIWQDAEDIFLSCVRTIREAVEKSGIDPARVAALSIDGQMAGIMGIGQDGEAVTYYDSWLDGRSSCYLDTLRSLGEQELVSVSGGPVTVNHATKILWWKNEEETIYNKIKKFVLPHGYVVNRLVGGTADTAVFDYTCLHFNSFSDNKNLCWNEAALLECGVDPGKLPAVTSPFSVAGTLTRQAAQACGLCQGVPVAVGAGDTAAGTFGAGIFEPGQMLDSAGTAAVLSCVVDKYRPDTAHQTLTMMRSPIDGRWLPLAYIGGGGLCLRWCRDQFTGNPPATYDMLEREAAALPPGSEGLLFCPHFSGRSLPPDPSLRGAFWGLDFKHTRGHLYRAIMEAIAYEYAQYYDIMRANGLDVKKNGVVCIGGGAKSDLFCQIKADVLNLPIETYETGETALIGTAVIAGTAAGVIDDYTQVIRQAMRRKHIFLPNSEKNNLYQMYRRAYREMIPKCR